ncbi:NAD-aldehyde dehydrogenase [Vararia minispora EC-137]|uniref:NAD-aldehyde dehydrogenase n=1 Tax=Vararia minispora EC-137 TaxID=1314806 RepID=A0ACB8QVG3_9AGAM|nr:NAD-aldehyde dehydrogenase [Vararia minispora EC-137]
MAVPDYVPTPVDDIPTIRAELGAAFRAGTTKPIANRREQLLALAYLLKDNIDRFKEALASDLGRPALETDVLEVGGTLHEIKDAYDSVARWARPQRAPFALNYAAMRPTIRKEPKGVVLIIVPFNYPLLLTLEPLAGAIAAGCAAVVKPSELTPAFSALLADLVPQYLDPALYRVVNGAVPETTKLLEQPWDHILFTGSARVARIVLAAAARTLSPVTTELGGKSPVIVDASCDLRTTARRLVWGKTANAGQTCVAPDYVLVPRAFQDKLVQACIDVLKEFYPDGAAESDSYSRIVSPGHHARLSALLEKSGGTTAYGGGKRAEDKFIEPTIVTGVGLDDSLMSEELFGPVLPIIAVEDINEAIQIVNARDHPLALYVFTQDSRVKKQVLDGTQSGGAVVNDCLLQVTADGLPFGGIGPSGSGSHTGKYSFDMFTHTRSTLDNPSWLDLVMGGRFPPFTDKSTRMMRALLVPSLPARKSKSAANRWGSYWVMLSLACAAAAYGAKLIAERKQ